MVFGHHPKSQKSAAQIVLIRDHDDWDFSLIMNDYIVAFISFEAMFHFLHYDYFPCAIFGPVYLIPYKTFVFTNQFDFVGFSQNKNRLRPSIKHRERINH